MALWFCELRAKEVINVTRKGVTFSNNRWATKRQINSRYIVNVNEYEFGEYEEE
jgi:hypothetical protein